ncbi:MAG: terminase [Dehalococcoidia bacterium]
MGPVGITGDTTSFRVLTPEGRLSHLNMHDGQIRAFESTARFVFMLAGPQGGKTCFGPHWLHRKILKGGPGDYLAVTSTYDQFKLKMMPELRTVFEDLEGIGRYWAGSRVMELCDPGGRFLAKHQDDRMWARIILRSAEARVGLEAATARAAWLDEVGQPSFTRGAYEAILRRLSLAQGPLLGTTTLYEWGWLKNEIYDRWVGGDPDIEVVQFDSLMNPAFPRAEYERARRTLPGWKFNLMYRGIFEKPAGLVYDCFDEAACLVPRFPIPDHWHWYVGHDFGSANPAAMFYTVDPTHTGLIYAVAEYQPGSRSVFEQVEDFKKITEGRYVIKRIGGSHQEEGWRGDYTAHGWPIQEPKDTVRDVEVGIGKVYALHKLNRVMVFSDLHNYLDQKQSYSYRLNRAYQPSEEIEDRARFHLMDAERYILSDFVPETMRSGGAAGKRKVRF